MLENFICYCEHFNTTTVEMEWSDLDKKGFPKGQKPVVFSKQLRNEMSKENPALNASQIVRLNCFLHQRQTLTRRLFWV